jgi:hypothetical protein
VVHTLPALVGQRIVGIALGYEDVNDHDDLRHDPVLALFADRLEPKRSDCAPLAGKSTLNRLEHAPLRADDRYHKIDHDPAALANLFVDLFWRRTSARPSGSILDLDATDDPLHGEQEGRFFHPRRRRLTTPVTWRKPLAPPARPGPSRPAPHRSTRPPRDRAHPWPELLAYSADLSYR